jgi:hypothetical protein
LKEGSIERKENGHISIPKEMVSLTIAFLMFALPACAGEVSVGERLMGGTCDYKKYDGHAVITSIVHKTDLKNPSEEKYEVKFHFYPDEEIQEPFAQTEGKEFILLVKGEFARAEFLRKHGIRVGKVLHGSLKVITRGTCTPTVFEFPFAED